MPWSACPQSPPKLGGDALAKRGLGRSVQKPAKRLLMNSAKRTELLRSASRISIRSLRGFEQTAPPSLREGTPPDSGGEFRSSNTFLLVPCGDGLKNHLSGANGFAFVTVTIVVIILYGSLYPFGFSNNPR